MRPRAGLVQESASAFGGQPISAGRLVDTLADCVDLVPLWLEEGDDVRPHAIGAARGWRIGARDAAGAADRLIAVARQEKLEALHLYGAIQYPVACALAAGFLDAPLIVSFIGSDINLGLYWHPADLSTLVNAATVCTVYNAHQERLARRLFGARSPVFQVLAHVRPEGLDARPVDLPLERPRIGCVAEYRRVTGLDLLLEAFARIATRSRASLLLVGPLAPLEADYYTRLLDTAACRDRILRTGTVPHHAVGGYVAACDVMAFPSLAEGLPNKVMEAMAGGTCVVAARVPGNSDLIEDGVDGRLFEPRDVEALEAALDEALANPGKRAAWARSARDKVARHYTRTRERSAWIECYRAAGIRVG